MRSDVAARCAKCCARIHITESENKVRSWTHYRTNLSSKHSLILSLCLKITVYWLYFVLRLQLLTYCSLLCRCFNHSVQSPTPTPPVVIIIQNILHTSASFSEALWSTSARRVTTLRMALRVPISRIPICQEKKLYIKQMHEPVSQSSSVAKSEKSPTTGQLNLAKCMHACMYVGMYVGR